MRTTAVSAPLMPCRARGIFYHRAVSYVYTPQRHAPLHRNFTDLLW
nr:MAG TPA: hypothetical protein [Caudoviricetes sp.]